MTRREAIEFTYEMRFTRPELSGCDIARLLVKKGYNVTDRTVNDWLKQADLSRDTQPKMPRHILEEMRFMWGFGRTSQQIADALLQNHGISLGWRRVYALINEDGMLQQGQIKEAVAADDDGPRELWRELSDELDDLSPGRDCSDIVAKYMRMWTDAPVAPHPAERTFAKVRSISSISRKSKAA